jgi:hypothetical protein
MERQYYIFAVRSPVRRKNLEQIAFSFGKSLFVLKIRDRSEFDHFRYAIYKRPA